MSNIKKNNEQQENNRSTFDLTDDFKCAELLLDADEDKDAFEIFLRLATEDNKKRKNAIDKLLYIALKNSHNSNLLNNDTWKKIKKLSEKGRGYEYAYLLLHFKYYSQGKRKGAYNSLKSYFENMYYSLRKDKADFKVIMEYFKDNAKGISPIAYLQYGICLEWGIGIPLKEVSTKEAMRYYRKALEGGCVAAYKYIVELYLFGAVGFDKNLKKAKNEFNKGITDFKNRFRKNEKDIKPFFKMLVGLCFMGDWGEEMGDEGKELAQYMIENDVKGGYSLMGQSFLSWGEFNPTMAKNYFEEALKNDETSAYGGLAMINLVEGNREETFKLAHKGFSENDLISFGMLGMLYEEQGDKENNKNRQKSCYDEAWNIYLKAYKKFGTASDQLGCLYLDKEVLGKKSELEHALGIGTIQLRLDSIKYYLRLQQKNNGKDSARINFENAPVENREDYIKYLKYGAKSDNGVLRNEYNRYIDFVFDYEDEKTRIKLSKELVKDFYIVGSKKQFIDVLENYFGKQDVSFIVYFAKSLSKLHFKNSKEIPDEYRNYLISGSYTNDDLRIDMDFVCKHMDEKTKANLFKKLVEDDDLYIDYSDFVFSHADEKIRAKLSRKLVDNSYVPSSKKQFADIIKNYNGKQEVDFNVWLINTWFLLFYNENKEECNEIKDAIEKTEDEGLKESLNTVLRELLKKHVVEDEGIGMTSSLYTRQLLLDLFYSKDKESKKDVGNLSEIKREPAIVNFLSAIENSKDKGLKKTIEKFNNELLDFFDSCFIETPSESSDSHAEDNGK